MGQGIRVPIVGLAQYLEGFREMKGACPEDAGVQTECSTGTQSFTHSLIMGRLFWCQGLCHSLLPLLDSAPLAWPPGGPGSAGMPPRAVNLAH